MTRHNYQSIVKDPEYDHSGRRWNPEPENILPGSTFSGDGLFFAFVGSIASFVITFDNIDTLPEFEVALIRGTDDAGDIVDLNFEAIPGYGYRIIFVPHEIGFHRIQMVFHKRIVLTKTINVFASRSYGDDLKSSIDYLLKRLEQVTSYNTKYATPVIKLMNDSAEILASIDEAGTLWTQTLEQVKNSARKSAASANKIIEIIDLLPFPDPAAEDEERRGGGDNGPNDGDNGDGPRGQDDRPPPPQFDAPQPPKEDKPSVPSIFTDSVLFTGIVRSLPGDIRARSEDEISLGLRSLPGELNICAELPALDGIRNAASGFSLSPGPDAPGPGTSRRQHFFASDSGEIDLAAGNEGSEEMHRTPNNKRRRSTDFEASEESESKRQRRSGSIRDIGESPPSSSTSKNSSSSSKNSSSSSKNSSSSSKNSSSSSKNSSSSSKSSSSSSKSSSSSSKNSSSSSKNSSSSSKSSSSSSKSSSSSSKSSSSSSKSSSSSSKSSSSSSKSSSSSSKSSSSSSKSSSSSSKSSSSSSKSSSSSSKSSSSSSKSSSSSSKSSSSSSKSSSSSSKSSSSSSKSSSSSSKSSSSSSKSSSSSTSSTRRRAGTMKLRKGRRVDYTKFY